MLSRQRTFKAMLLFYECCTVVATALYVTRARYRVNNIRRRGWQAMCLEKPCHALRQAAKDVMLPDVTRHGYITTVVVQRQNVGMTGNREHHGEDGMPGHMSVQQYTYCW